MALRAEVVRNLEKQNRKHNGQELCLKTQKDRGNPGNQVTNLELLLVLRKKFVSGTLGSKIMYVL